MERAAAFSFIRATKASSEPATVSAMATAASLAEAMLIHLISVSTVCISPASKKTCDPPMEAACSETLTWVSGEICPFSMASKIKSRVMTLVTLAMGSLATASFSYRIQPVEASIKTAEGQDKVRAVSCVSSASSASAGIQKRGRSKRSDRSRHKRDL